MALYNNGSNLTKTAGRKLQILKVFWAVLQVKPSVETVEKGLDLENHAKRR